MSVTWLNGVVVGSQVRRNDAFRTIGAQHTSRHVAAEEGGLARPGSEGRGLGGTDAAQRAYAGGGRKRRPEHLCGEDEGCAGRPRAGDDSHHGICLGEDEEDLGERGTAANT